MPQPIDKNAQKVLRVLGSHGEWMTLRELHHITSIKVVDLDQALSRLGEFVQSRRAWGGRRVGGKREVVRQWRINPNTGEA